MKYLCVFLIFLVIICSSITLASTTNGETTWYLAEGCTNGFDEWVLIQNPNTSSAECTITFMDPDGNTQLVTDTIPANTRRTYHVNNHMPGQSVSTKIESTNSVGVIAERAMYWNGGGHCSKGATATACTWYLAEGCTNGFDTWIPVQNPNSSSAASCTLTFMDQDGNTQQVTDNIPANSRRSYHVNEYMPDKDVSTKVESNNYIGIIAERAMYWDGGGHCSLGASTTAITWYLAEGCTNGFTEWVLVQNPDANRNASVTITFMDQDGNTQQVTDNIPANSRRSYYVNGYMPDKDVSTKVESNNNVGVIAERAMYWDSGGHCSLGSTETGTAWYLAEGCTNGYIEWVLVQNPNITSAASCTITFMDQDGNTQQITDSVPANSRRSYNVNTYIPDKDVSTKVESDIGIIAERAMYWSGGGHNSIGVIQYVEAVPDPDYDNITYTLPTGASTLRLSLPTDIGNFLFDANGSIGGYGIHGGGHIEGLDHAWIELVPGTPAKSWADGMVTNVALSGNIEEGEYHITIDYGCNLVGTHMEVMTPYVASGDVVTRGQLVGLGISSTPEQTSGEIGLLDRGRTDGTSAFGGGTNVSPFDYLNAADKQILATAYKEQVLDVYADTNTEAWGFEPSQPYLTNQLFLHDGNEEKLTGVWYLTSADWGQDYPNDVLTFIEASNPYYTGNVVKSQDSGCMGDSWNIDGTFTVDYAAGRVMMVSTYYPTYYGIFEIDETTERATLRIEYQEGSYPTSFSSNALTYQQRTR